MVLENVKKSTLITKSRMYDWIVMPFGMKNVTNTFTRTMIKIFGSYIDKFLKVFIDDLNIHKLTWDEHLEHKSFVLMKLREVNLKLNPSKCEFAKTRRAFNQISKRSKQS